MSKFEGLQLVKHLNGGLYRIRRPPDHRLLEHNGEPFYEYEDIHSGQVWIRSKSEMEDGRFIDASNK